MKRQRLEFLKTIQKGAFQHHFQSIFSLRNNEVYGYECLLRSPFESNRTRFFKRAKHFQLLNQLDLNSIIQAVYTIENNICSFTENSKFFLNVYPSTLSSPEYFGELYKLFQQINIHPNRIVLEINEKERIQSVEHFSYLIQPLRDLGILIALDDFDQGVEPYCRLLEIKPDILKFDRVYSHHLNKKDYQQGVVQTIVNLSFAMNVTCIIEGIETSEDLQKAEELGIEYAQGFLLEKPKPLQSIITNH